MLEFPSVIDITGATCNGPFTCVVFPNLRVIEITTAPVGAAASYPTIVVSLVSTQNYEWNSPIVKLHQWDNHFAGPFKICERHAVAYDPLAALTIPTVNASTVPPEDIKNYIYWAVLSFRNGFAIQAGGTIEVDLPDNVTITNDFCHMDVGLTAAAGRRLECVIVGDVATITGFDTIANNTQIDLRFHYQTPTATGSYGDFVIKAYVDEAKTELVMEDTLAATTITAASLPAAKDLHSLEQTLPGSAGATDEYVEIRFKFNPSGALTKAATTYVEAAFATAF